MLDEIVIIGVTMIVAQLIKVWMRRRLGEALCHQLAPLVVLVLAGGLNVLNAWVFGMGMVPLLHSLAEGVKLGAMAGGVYSMGKASLGID
ncbi:MAG: hypothetical protein Q8P31_00215 [Bacillota bacterium]|nr:hypothetical protein [Bacillota bacterium]